MSYAEQLQAALVEPDRLVLRHIAATAAQLKYPLYLVGGSVRDCLLGYPINEFDLTVEGDAIALARSIASELNGALTIHDRFGTAKIWLPDQASAIKSIDVATTRTETYARPGALPDVTPGTIETDLIRRDFTINAMALRLDGDHFGELVDLYDGLHDLNNQLIRVLHARSFIDDPTRILRGARFEQHFDFAVEADTLNLIPDALPVIDQISGDRLRHEIELIWREARPDKPLARLQGWGVLWAIDRDLIFDDGTRASFQTHTAPFDRFTCWAWLLARRAPDALKRISARFNLPRDEAIDLEQVNELWGRQKTIGQAGTPSLIDRQLHPYHERAVRAALTLIDDEAARRNIERFLDELRAVRISLDGRQLLVLGLPPGPAIGRVLLALREARLDGIITTLQQEEAYARQLIAREVKGE
jgi:tRNA nucleotidyltransferase (CCA-adding enzyme)